MSLKTIGIIGSGQMGSGIAQVSALSGYSVILNDIKKEYVEKGIHGIEKFLSKSVEKERLTAEDKDAAMKRIKQSSDIKDMKDADFVIEAATENEELKFKIFQDLDSICSEDVILATNTSSIPIGRIAAKTNRPDKIIGMHFFNPVALMKLVEIIRGLTTSDDTFKTTWELAGKVGKTPAEAGDYPGFLVNRILIPMINDAVFCLYNGVGSREDIDSTMKLGANHPMGPLALADLIGLDTVLSIMETFYAGFGDSKFRPCPLLRRYVEAGWLGKKSKRGFYEY
ncbi:3-hydroxybutyryl-CoA dehydrogenase [Spirochaetota bacterium]